MSAHCLPAIAVRQAKAGGESTYSEDEDKPSRTFSKVREACTIGA